MKTLDQLLSENKKETKESEEIEMKYQGYIQKEEEQAEKLTTLEDVILGDQVDYTHIQSLSSEGREQLIQSRPNNIGQASRISGVTPSDISVLLVHMGR